MEENPNSNQSDENKAGNEESDCCLEDYFLNQACYFCLNKIDPEFYNDLFNLFGICNSTEEMKRNLRFIFQRRDYISDSNDEEEQQLIERKAISIYMQIHQRYIMSDTGIRKIYKRYMKGEFGKCPCYRCKWTPLLPVGLSDRPNVDSIKLLCPNCNGLYNVEYPYNMVDGAFFGESFGGFFFLNFSIHPTSLNKYEPSIFGFKIHTSSPYYQQSKPIEDEELFVCF